MRFLGHEICAKKRLSAANETIGPWLVRICVSKLAIMVLEYAYSSIERLLEVGRGHLSGCNLPRSSVPAIIHLLRFHLGSIAFSLCRIVSHISLSQFFNRGMKWESYLGSCSDSSQGRWPNF
jgi:hypothetical protein